MTIDYNTGMTLASAADSATNWNIARLAGSGGAPTFGGLDTTVFKQGTGSVSGKVSVANTDAAILLDWYANTEGGKSTNTTVNLTTSGNEVICGWVQLTTISAVRALSAEGLYLIISSSADSGTTAPTVYSKWSLSGSDVYPGGWVFFMVDTRKTPTVTAGGGANLAAVRRVGFGIFLTGTPGTIKSDNLFVDAIWYGRPRYRISQGSGGPDTATWALAYANSLAAANGLIDKVGSTMYLSCGVRFGNSAQTAATTFTDATGQLLEFKRYTYYYSGAVVDSLNYSDYYNVDADGASSFKTSVQIGTVVGSGDNRQGVLGGGIRSGDISNVTWNMDFSTNIANLNTIKLYGFDIVGAKGGILMNDGSKSSVVSCSAVNCGEIQLGTTNNGAEMLSCAVIDPLGATNNRGLRIPQANHNIKKVSFITSGTPSTQHMVHLSASGNYTTVFDGMKFFGDYSSGTLWHGENSGSTSGQTATISKTNESDPVQAEFNNTGGGSTSVTASFVLTLTDVPSGVQVTIVNSSTRTELQNTVSTGANITYSHSGGETVDILFNDVDYDPNASDIYDLTLPNGNSSIKIQMFADDNYLNP